MKYHVYFFDNGNTAVCDAKGQVAHLQESWFKMFANFLEYNGIDASECEFNLPGRLKASVVKKEGKIRNWQVTNA